MSRLECVPGLQLLRWLVLTLLCTHANADGAIAITEIMYHPSGTNVLEEWFEIRNTGASAVSLAGWTVTQGVRFAFPTNTLLPAGERLVIAADANAFRALHPTVTRVVAGWTGTLSHEGETIRIEDDTGAVADSVEYASEGDWARRRLGVPDRLGRQGWEWYAPHAGFGRSLELINESLPNEHGQNWGSSEVDGGTPGQPNSIASIDIPPLILDVAHSPLIPRSSDPVTITARLRDEQTSGVEGFLHWRVDGQPAFNTVPLSDDGTHGDGLPGDGLFGAVLPRQPSGTIIEFHLTARDAAGNTRVFPDVIPSEGPRTAYLAFQVDDSSYAGDQPVLRLIMTRAEYDYLAREIWGGAPFSDASVNGTFVATDGVLDAGTTTQVRYLCDFRNRGHGSRTAVPHNFHVAFPSDSPWKGRAGLNLNTHYTHSQLVGSTVFRRAGIPMPDSRSVQVRVNAAQLAKPGQEQFGSYVANETMDDRFVQRHFPLDDQGNLYRGIRDMIPGISSEADLSWKGPLASAYTNAYAKENHAFTDDWSDFIHLLDLLNHTPDDRYPETVRAVADVGQWMRYFAINTLLDNQENSLGIGEGDDFALYRGGRDTRFRLLPYDMDSVMGRGTRSASFADGLWRMTNVAVIGRFMKQPEFVPLYFQQLTQLAETVFAPDRMNPLLDQLLSDHVDAQTIAAMKAFNSNHVAYVLAQFPRSLTVLHDLPSVSGYPRSTSASIRLRGTAHPGTTRSVTVNGVTTSWIAWQGTWELPGFPLHPGLNRLTIEATRFDNSPRDHAELDVWFDRGAVTTTPATIGSDTHWSADAGPYLAPNGLTIAPGATLTLDPGTSVYLGAGAHLTISNGGRLLAEGTANAPIRFTSAPGTSTSWGGIVLRGAPGSPESRLSHVLFEGNGTTCIESSAGTLLLDHATFLTTSHPYVSLDDSSFVVSHCHFPATTAAFEPFHGTGGIKAGGRGRIFGCYFGTSMGYSDIIDFTGGNRPGQPILQIHDNVFTGSTDDILDLDGTDAWIEGNIFLHVHRNGAPDSSAAVSGGSSGGATSEITILGNLFFDCDNAVTAKQGNFYTLLHNTIVRVTQTGGADFDSGVVNVRDTTPDVTTFGRGAYLEGNIIVDAAKLVRNYDPAQTTVTWVGNLIPMPWDGPGRDNSTADPLLVHLPSMAETVFGTWDEAQVLRRWFALQPGSPAIRAGANERDLGGVIPRGVFLSGEPPARTASTAATFHVGILRADHGIPTSGFPLGSGFTHYRWSLDDGPWSDPSPIGSPIVLSNLTAGSHFVRVSGRNDAGAYQDDPELGPLAVATSSRTWIVDPSFVEPPRRPTVQIHEILARNDTWATPDQETPDLIELHNPGPETVDVSGMGLTDNAREPHKFSFPAGTRIEPGGFLVVRAAAVAGSVPLSTGFTLEQSGDDLSLFDAPEQGGGLLDTVRFGIQVPDSSIGRLLDGSWSLCVPTFGAPNRPQRTGSPYGLRINEWLADAQFIARNDFIELFNPDALPVAIGGWFLSDAAGSPTRHPIAPLSFVAARGHARFIADADPAQGPDHLGFKLSPEVGLVRLSDPEVNSVDVVSYGPQRTDISQGRTPDGGLLVTSFPLPTPGGGNPGRPAGECTVDSVTVRLLELGSTWRYQQTANLDGTPWFEPDFDDASWPSGPALLAVETSPLPAPGKQTSLNLGRNTYYFRTHFLVETQLDGFQLNLTMVVDDGAVLYLNGHRLWTNGMASGSPSYATAASRNVDNASQEFFSVPASVLQPGTNVLAAEVHQINSGSSDIVWGLAIDATRVVTNCPPASLATVALDEILAVPAGSESPGTAPVAFIELLNTGDAAQDLSGMSVTDDASFAGKWVFPTNTVLAPGQSFVLVCDPNQPASPTNSGFRLRDQGGAVFLFHRPSFGGGLIDALNYGLQTPGFSVGRIPSGIGAWTLTLPSPGSLNRAAGLASTSNLRVNEWMADPITGADWLELFNTSDLPVPLAGLYLTDDLSHPAQSPLAPLSFLGSGPNAYRQIFADGDIGAGANHVSFSLWKSGEELGLFTPIGILLDGLTFGPQPAGVSQGRFPDGTPAFQFFVSSPSPGASNRIEPTDSDGDGMSDAWEREHFQTLARDGTGDWDQDQASDLAEYIAGTDPTHPGDALRLTVVSTQASTVLQFTGVAGKSYAIQARSNLESASWETLKRLPSQPASGPVSFSDTSPPAATRFYRVVTPAPPNP